MTRRQFVIASLVFVSIGLLHCTGFRGSSSGEKSPAGSTSSADTFLAGSSSSAEAFLAGSIEISAQTAQQSNGGCESCRVRCGAYCCPRSCGSCCATGYRGCGDNCAYCCRIKTLETTIALASDSGATDPAAISPSGFIAGWNKSCVSNSDCNECSSCGTFDGRRGDSGTCQPRP